MRADAGRIMTVARGNRHRGGRAENRQGRGDELRIGKPFGVDREESMSDTIRIENPSVGTQGRDRVRPAGAACREIRGQHRGHAEDKWCADKRNRAPRTDETGRGWRGALLLHQHGQ